MPEIPSYHRNVQVPDVPRGARLPLVLPGYGGQALVQSLADLGAAAQKVDEADAVAYTVRETADAERHSSTLLVEMQQQAPEGAPGFAADVDAKFQAYAADVVARAPNDQARELVNARLTNLGVDLFKRAVSFEAKARRAAKLADIERAGDALAVAAYNDPAGAGRYLTQAHGNLTAADATGITAGDARAEGDKLTAKITEAAVKGLIATEPDVAVSALAVGHFDVGLDAAKKAALVRSAKEASAAAERDRKAAIREADAAAKKLLESEQKATANDFLARLNDPAAGEAAKSPPTLREVLASNLEPTGEMSKKMFVGLIEKKRQGADLNVTDPRVYRDLSGQILDGTITDRKQLLPRIGDGLGINDAERLERDIERARTDAGKFDLALKKRTIDFARSQLVGGKGLMPGERDITGEKRLLLFEAELDKNLAKGQRDGKSYSDMLNPLSPDYMSGPLVAKYYLTWPEKLKMQADFEKSRAKMTASPEAGAAKRVNLPPAPRAESDRVIGDKYRAADGRTVEWTGQGWKVVP